MLPRMGGGTRSSFFLASSAGPSLTLACVRLAKKRWRFSAALFFGLPFSASPVGGASRSRFSLPSLLFLADRRRSYSSLDALIWLGVASYWGSSGPLSPLGDRFLFDPPSSRALGVLGSSSVAALSSLIWALLGGFFPLLRPTVFPLVFPRLLFPFGRSMAPFFFSRGRVNTPFWSGSGVLWWIGSALGGKVGRPGWCSSPEVGAGSSLWAECPLMALRLHMSMKLASSSFLRALCPQVRHLMIDATRIALSHFFTAVTRGRTMWCS